MYALVGDEVCWCGMIVDRADPRSFTPLAWDWGKDREHVYQHGVRVAGAHAATFVPLDARFGRDAERVFGACRPLEADVATFRTVGGGYAIDASGVFFGERRLVTLTACWKIDGADPSTFVALAHGWGVDATRTYCAGFAASHADPARLVPLTTRLATDGELVIAQMGVVPADPRTFRPLDEHFAVDATRVYHGDTYASVVEGANPATFCALGGELGTDDQYVYWMSRTVAGVPPETFLALSASFACSCDQVLYFYRGLHGQRHIVRDRFGVKPIVLARADPDTFRDIGELYGADARHAYYHSMPIELRGDARCFETLGMCLARDDRAVYFENRVVEGADPATFRLVATTTAARDRERWYLYDAYSDYRDIEVVDEERARAALDERMGFFGEDEAE
jgi:hypothetical protein